MAGPGLEAAAVGLREWGAAMGMGWKVGVVDGQ